MNAAPARSSRASASARSAGRPAADEVDGLLAVFRAGSASGGFARGIELGLQAILQSPSFLYRIELGQSKGSIPGAVKLTPYEVASRLSYALWGTMPDEPLMRAADDDRLSTPVELAAQARRMLADPRARQTLVAFTERWFGMELLDEVMKDPDRYPQFNEEMIVAMKREVHTFVEQVVFEGDGRFQTLLSASYGYPDATLAGLYGVTAPAAGGKVPVSPADQRAGLLTNVGVLTAHTFSDESAAIHRGKFVRERLLCTPPPNPPADLMVEPPAPQPGRPHAAAADPAHRRSRLPALPRVHGPHRLRVRELRRPRPLAHHGPGQAGRRQRQACRSPTSTGRSRAWSELAEQAGRQRQRRATAWRGRCCGSRGGPNRRSTTCARNKLQTALAGSRTATCASWSSPSPARTASSTARIAGEVLP